MIINLRNFYDKYTPVYSVEQYVDYEGRELPYIRWSFADHNDELVEGMSIPLFAEDMECCYSFSPLFPNNDFVLQLEILKHLGFNTGDTKIYNLWNHK